MQNGLIAHLVLDTNLVGFDPPLGSNDAAVLVDAARRGLFVLVVPELVLRETMNKWRETMDGRLRKLQGAVKNMGELAADLQAPGEAELDALQSKVEAEFREQLDGVNFWIPGLPAVSHESLVSRALRREQPFDAQGKDGYRDALLWETVVELAGDQNVVLVSKDFTAFAAEDKETLSKRLRAEVVERTGREGAVELCTSLEQAVESFAGENAVVADRAARLVRVESFRTILTEQLEGAVSTHYLNASERSSLGFPVEVPYAHVVGLTRDLGKITVDRAFQIGDGLGLVDLSIYAGVQIGFFAPFSQAMALRDRKDVWPADGSDWDELFPSPGEDAHLMTSRFALLRAECAIRLVPGTISRLQVTGVTPLPLSAFEEADPSIDELPGDVWPAEEIELSDADPSA